MEGCISQYYQFNHYMNDCIDTSFETSSRWRDQSASPNVTCSLVNTSHTDTQHMPADDHTYGSKQNGSYMLLGSETGDHVVVTTRDNVLWENVCGLRLWYYVLSGRPQLSFTVHKDSNKQVVLEHACNGFSKWHLAEMAVGYQLVGSKVMLDVSSADASRFKVAIDDVEFTECAGVDNTVKRDRQTDIQTDTYRRTNKQTDRQTDRQRGKQTDK